jgi:hypothetical protein
MVFDNILQLQRQWTDKYVVVDDARPELKRFSGMTGVVKTVNFSGRALVQFDANNNIGWFDIDPRFLKIVDAPLPKPAAKEAKTEKKAAPVKQDKPADAKPIGEKPAPKPGGSVADILAAARAGKGGAAETKPAAAAKPEAKKMSVADIMAAARGAKPATPAEAAAVAAPVTSTPAPAPVEAPDAPAKIDPKKLSVADMLAMARGQKPAGAPAATTGPAVPAAVTAVPAPPAVPETPPVPEPEAAASDDSPSSSPVRVDRSKMDVAAMVAYCRRVDGKG